MRAIWNHTSEIITVIITVIFVYFPTAHYAEKFSDGYFQSPGDDPRKIMIQI